MKFGSLGLVVALSSLHGVFGQSEQSIKPCSDLNQNKCIDEPNRCVWQAAGACVDKAATPSGDPLPGTLGGKCDSVYKDLGNDQVKYTTPTGGQACGKGLVCQSNLEPGDEGVEFEGICQKTLCHGRSDPDNLEELKDDNPSNEASIRVTICHRTCSETNPWVRITIDDDAWNGTAASGCGHQQHDIRDECADKDPWKAWGENRKDYLIRWHGTRDWVREQWGWDPLKANGLRSAEEKKYWFYWERACPYVRKGACCGTPDDITTGTLGTGACCGDDAYPNILSSIELEKKVVAAGNNPCALGHLMDRSDDELETHKGHIGSKVVYAYEIYNNGDIALCNVKLSDPEITVGAFADYILPKGTATKKSDGSQGVMTNGCLKPKERVCMLMPNNGNSEIPSTGSERKDAVVVATPSGVIPGGTNDRSAKDAAGVEELPPPKDPVINLEKKVGKGVNLECPNQAMMSEEYTDAEGTEFTYYYTISVPADGVEVCNIYLTDSDISSGAFQSLPVTDDFDPEQTSMVGGCLKPGKSICIPSPKTGSTLGIPKIPTDPEDKNATVVGTNEEKTKETTASDNAKVLPVSIKLEKKVVGPNDYSGTGACPSADKMFEIYAGVPGTVVYYSYTIKNTGDKTICSVTLSDGSLVTGAFTGSTVSDSTMTNGCLAPGQEVCIMSPGGASSIPSEDKDKDDKATVVALPEGEAPGNEVTAENDAGVLPTSITVDKVVEGGLHNECPVDMTGTFEELAGSPGSEVTVYYYIKNTGSTPLCHIHLEDSSLAVNGFGSTEMATADMPGGCLAPGAVYCHLVKSKIPNVHNDSEAHVTGIPSEKADSPYTPGNPVEDNDNAILSPAIIVLEKKVSLDETVCPNAEFMTPESSVYETASGVVGDTVTYFYQFTNKGAVTLCNILLSDSVTGAPFTNIDVTPVGCLPPGQAACVPTPTTTKPTIPEGGETILAVISAIPSAASGEALPNLGPVTDSNSASVTVSSPKIFLSKQVVGPGDYASGCPNEGLMKLFAAPAETEAYYVYTIANQGDTPLCKITLSDPLLEVGGFSNYDVMPDLCLPVGEIVCVVGPGGKSVVPGNKNDINDEAVVTSLPEGAPDVPENYVQSQDIAGVVPAGVDIVKKVTPGDVTVCPTDMTGQLDTYEGEVSERVTYLFEITNTGATPLCGLVLQDNVTGSSLSGGYAIPVNTTGMVGGCLPPGASLCFPAPPGPDDQETVIPEGGEDTPATIKGTPTCGASMADPMPCQVGFPIPNPSGSIEPVTDSDNAGVTVVVTPPVPGVTLEKKVIGPQDTPLTACPNEGLMELFTGLTETEANYVYTITNTGNEPLCSITLSDSDLVVGKFVDVPVAAGGDIIMETGCLPVGGAVCALAPNSSAVPSGNEDVNDEATVSAVGSSSGSSTSASDTAGVIPSSVEIEKKVQPGPKVNDECPMADMMNPDVLELAEGEKDDPVTFFYLITNTGASPLCNVKLTDSATGVNLAGSSLDNLNGMVGGCLPVGGSVCIPFQGSIPLDGENTTATVEGTPSNEDGTPIPGPDGGDFSVTDGDNAAVGILPAPEPEQTLLLSITLEKKVVADLPTITEGGACPLEGLMELYTAPVGTRAYYTYNITNTGQEPLCSVLLNDPVLTSGAITNMPVMADGTCLGVGESVCIVGPQTLIPSGNDDEKDVATVTASGQTQTDKQVSAEDTAGVLPEQEAATLSITLQKEVVAASDVTEPGVCPNAGRMETYTAPPETPAFYTYTIENTGNEPLCNVFLSDSALENGAFTDTPVDSMLDKSCLAVGEIVCVLVETKVPDNTNDQDDLATVTAHGQTQTGTQVTASDRAGVLPETTTAPVIPDPEPQPEPDVLPPGDCPYPMDPTPTGQLPGDLCLAEGNVVSLVNVVGSAAAEAYIRSVESTLLYDISFTSATPVAGYGIQFKVNNPFTAADAYVQYQKPIGQVNAYGDECWPMSFSNGCPATGDASTMSEAVVAQCVKPEGSARLAHTIVDVYYVTNDERAMDSTSEMGECCESAATQFTGIPLTSPIVKLTYYMHCECPPMGTARKLRGSE